MRKYIPGIIIIIFVGLPLLGVSQQRFTIEMKNRPATEVFNAVENLTGYKMYYIPSQTDSLTLSVTALDKTPYEIVAEALAGTSMRVTEFGGALFVLKEKALVADVPAGFYDSRNKQESVAGNIFELESRDDQVAGSQFKVYEIGDPNARPSGKVTLHGYVVDANTGQPLPGVALQIGDSYTAVSTNKDGYYVFSLVPGRYEINIRGGGQEESKRIVQLYSGGKLDIQSSEKVYSLGEVVVSDPRRSNVIQTTMGTERLIMRDIKNIPTAFGESDIMKVVTMLPGVKTAGEISSGFNVRGGATDQNLILYNSSTIYNPTHLFGLFSAFNPDLVNDMDLYKSSIPAKYGGRISSVLDINSREGNKKEFEGAASIGVLTSRVTVEGPMMKDKSSFILGGRMTYSDWLLGLLPESSGYKDGKAGFYDLNASFNFALSERDAVFVNGYFSRDRFRFDEDELYRYRNANASARWRHIFTPEFIGSFTVGYDHYDYDFEYTATPVNANVMKFKIDQVHTKADFTWFSFEKHELGFGLNAIYYNFMPGERGPLGAESARVYERIPREKALESALYVSDKWDITDKLTLDLGIRFSMFNVLGPRDYNVYDPQYLPDEVTVVEQKSGTGIMKTYGGPEFRASLRYAFTPNFSFKAGVNTMRQYIHKVSNTSVMSPTDTWKLSDMNIKPQKGRQFAAGLYTNLFQGRVEASLEAYYKTMDDYLDYRAGAQIVMQEFIETQLLPTEGKAYGIELMFKKNTGKLNGWVSYTYSRTKLRQTDPRITLPVNHRQWYPADFDKPHELKFVGNYKFTHRYSLSVNCEYTTGRPITVPRSKYDYQGSEYVEYSDRNEYRVPDYFRTDISFNIEPGHHLKGLTHSMFSVGVYNVTGRENIHSIFYRQDEFGKIKSYKLCIFAVPIPYVSYNIRF